MKLQPTSTSDTQLLGFWMFMNIINGIAREALSFCFPPPSLAPTEQTLWKRSRHCGRGAPTTLAHTECLKVWKEFGC